MMSDLKKFEVWFVTGSQHLYGPETLKQVAEDSKKIITASHRVCPYSKATKGNINVEIIQL